LAAKAGDDHFLDFNADRIPEPHRAAVEDVLSHAIQTARPDHERWTVTTHELPEGRIRIYDFARGEAPAVADLTDVDDSEYSTLFRAASHFLRTQWSGALTLA
jgi:hypothetical protein